MHPRVPSSFWGEEAHVADASMMAGAVGHGHGLEMAGAQEGSGRQFLGRKTALLAGYSKILLDNL